MRAYGSEHPHYDRHVTTQRSTTPRATRLRMVAVAVIAATVSGLAIMAGTWQFGRYEDRADARAAFETASALPRVSLESLAQPGSPVPPSAVWREVTVVGTFDASSLTILRNRPIDSRPTWQYLAWFRPSSGGALLVNLGHAPQPDPSADVPGPDLDLGEVSLAVVLRQFEPDDSKRGESASRILPAHMPPPAEATFEAYGMLREVCADGQCEPIDGLAPVPIPELTTGPHLSYAWQWWVFAALSPVGAWLLMRREREDDAAASIGRAERSSRRTREPSDEQIEDALAETHARRG